MNERIKELEKQSYITFKDENSFDCLVFSKEKFAELIVKECSDVLEKKESFYGEWAGNVIKEHFGIK